MAPSPQSRRWRAAGGLPALIGLALVAGCSDRTKSLDTFADKGDNAAAINDIAVPMFIAAGVVGVLVFAAVGFIVVKFRDKGDESEMPEQSHGNKVVEISLTAVSAALLVVFAAPMIPLIQDLNAEAKDSITVKVEGQQWWWSFVYDMNGNGEFDDPEDITTADELVIPVGPEINLTVTSNDVIHSFWIPNLNGKRDAVPGLESFWKVQANEEGAFLGQCTEFCGLSHANMRMLTRAVSPEAFDNWVANQQKAQELSSLSDAAQVGGDAFITLCSSCHLVDGINNKEWQKAEALVAKNAPDLTHFASRGTFAGGLLDLYAPGSGGVGDPLLDPETGQATAEPITNDLEDWLRDPEAIAPQAPDEGRGMPNLNLSEEQIDQLVAFLTELD